MKSTFFFLIVAGFHITEKKPKCTSSSHQQEFVSRNQLAARCLGGAQLWQVNATSRLLQVIYQLWRGDSRGTLMFCFWFGLFFSCWFHPLESRGLGTARGVEGAPAALYRYTSPRFQAQTHQKRPWQAAISWDWLPQYRRI